MAKSGQRISQRPHQMQSSQRTTKGSPSSRTSKTLVGQKATHIPHLLHQASLTSIAPSLSPDPSTVFPIIYFSFPQPERRRALAAADKESGKKQGGRVPPPPFRSPPVFYALWALKQAEQYTGRPAVGRKGTRASPPQEEQTAR